MNKTILFVFVSMIVVAMSGCTEGKTETQVRTDEGTVKITGTAGENPDDWCPEGGNWGMKSTGMEEDVSATWKIDRLVKSGKYSGLCHVIYTMKTSEGDTKIDYWFDESGENGFIEMDLNGQKISQEWHG
ncbi:MAG: hypothetical protein V3R86_08145 [Candidatus Hydrothermarchaeaceae archaeon]